MTKRLPIFFLLIPKRLHEALLYLENTLKECIVHSDPYCASQPISLHRMSNFWPTLSRILTTFVISISKIIKSLSKSVKWAMQPFPKEQSEKERSKL